MNFSVLVCDDSNMARKQVLRSLPEKLSSVAIIAKNGEEALNLLRTTPVDIMFLDLTMPVLDGLDVLKAIKEEAIKVQVFVISADIQPDMQSKVLALGAKEFMKKPVNSNDLISNLKKHNVL